MRPRDILHGFLFVLFRRKWLIASLFAVSLGGVCGYSYMTYPLYKATVSVMIPRSPRQQVILFRDIVQPPTPEMRIAPAANFVEIARSPTIARELVMAFGLDARMKRRAESPETIRERWWYSVNAVLYSPIRLLEILGLLEESEPDYVYEAAIKLLEDHTEIFRVFETELVHFSIWEERPELAAAIANELLQRLLKKTVELSQAQASIAFQFTKEQVDIAGQTLNEIEDKLAQYRRDHALISLETQEQLLLARADKLAAELDELWVLDNGLRARLAELDRTVDETRPIILSSTVAAQNPLIPQVKSTQVQSELEIASLEPELRPANPEIVRLRAKVDRGYEVLREEPETVIQSRTTSVNPLHQDLTRQLVGAQVDVESSSARAQALNAKSEILAGQLRELPVKALLLARLEREAEAQRELYTNLKAKLDGLSVQQVSRLSEFDIRIVDEAYLPAAAGSDYPSWTWTLIIAVPASLLLALLTGFLVNYFDETYSTAAALERDLALPVLGCVPASNRVA